MDRARKMQRLSEAAPGGEASARASARGRAVRSTQGHRGAAIVEAVIALPILLAVILGAIQFALIYQAKATLNHASLQAARAGAVSNADPEIIRRGLARGLAPLYSPESSLHGLVTTVARVNAALVTDARVRILNPTREAFADFGEEVAGVREIPNDRLHARSTAIGAASGVNVQDANLLKLEVTYGHELKVPLVNWFIARLMLRPSRAGADAFEQQLLRRMRLPIVAAAVVRMQSQARLSAAVASRDDLPAIDRIPADARRSPESDTREGDGESGPQGESVAGSQNDGSNLADGFLGFGSGHVDSTDDDAEQPALENPSQPDTNGEADSDDSSPDEEPPPLCTPSEGPPHISPARATAATANGSPAAARTARPSAINNKSQARPETEPAYPSTKRVAWTLTAMMRSVMC